MLQSQGCRFVGHSILKHVILNCLMQFMASGVLQVFFSPVASLFMREMYKLNLASKKVF